MTDIGAAVHELVPNTIQGTVAAIAGVALWKEVGQLGASWALLAVPLRFQKATTLARPGSAPRVRCSGRRGMRGGSAMADSAPINVANMLCHTGASRSHIRAANGCNVGDPPCIHAVGPNADRHPAISESADPLGGHGG